VDKEGFLPDGALVSKAWTLLCKELKAAGLKPEDATLENLLCVLHRLSNDGLKRDIIFEDKYTEKIQNFY
jgi:hypothetical protein